MECGVRQHPHEEEGEEGLAPTGEGMPTPEEELAKKAEEGWPGTQGKWGEVSDIAAKNACASSGTRSSASDAIERL